MINNSESRCAAVRICHSYYHWPNWTPLSTITIKYPKTYLNSLSLKPTSGFWFLIISNSSHRKIRVCGNDNEILNWSCPVLHLWSSRSTLVWGWGSHFWFDASKKHLQPAFRQLLQTKCRLSDKLRRLLCLLHKWHTQVSPPPLRHKLNRCWLKKLWVLCNRIIIGYIYVYYALVLLQPVSVLWLVMNTPLFKDQKKNNNNNEIKYWQRRKKREKKNRVK